MGDAIVSKPDNKKEKKKPKVVMVLTIVVLSSTLLMLSYICYQLVQKQIKDREERAQQELNDNKHAHIEEENGEGTEDTEENEEVHVAPSVAAAPSIPKVKPVKAGKPKGPDPSQINKAILSKISPEELHAYNSLMQNSLLAQYTQERPSIELYINDKLCVASDLVELAMEQHINPMVFDIALTGRPEWVTAVPCLHIRATNALVMGHNEITQALLSNTIFCDLEEEVPSQHYQSSNMPPPKQQQAPEYTDDELELIELQRLQQMKHGKSTSSSQSNYAPTHAVEANSGLAIPSATDGYVKNVSSVSSSLASRFSGQSVPRDCRGGKVIIEES